MMPAQAGLPKAMVERLKGRALLPMSTPGRTRDEIHTVIGGAPEILKVSRILQEELKRQQEALRWLEGKLPVPKVLGFEEGDGASALWISRLDGEDASVWCQNEAPEKVAQACARALLMVHSLPMEACPLDARLDRKLGQARERVQNGLVDQDDLDDERRGMAPEALLKQLEPRPADEDLVFTHGDFCLPNLMFADGELQGFVDWGRCGVADRYQDLALLLRSLKDNLGMDLRGPVGAAYGIRAWDEEKLEYYRLLDEFF